ncbi:MAG: hypothetical protein V3S28_04940 [Acidimicrobiia bacterium]
MTLPTESGDAPHRRATPGWLRVTIWVAITFLAMSVITGMFLY